MKSANCFHALIAAAFLLSAISASGCATDRARLAAAERATAEKAAVDEAARIAGQAAPLPEMPADCRQMERAGVFDADPADAALLKYDRALGRGNARILRCADWFDRLRAARNAGHAGPR